MVSLLRVLFTEKSCKKTDQENYRIEKVIRKTKDKALVKWKGYPDEFNSWVSLKDLTNLYYKKKL